jgi:hypothetical protein
VKHQNLIGIQIQDQPKTMACFDGFRETQLLKGKGEPTLMKPDLLIADLSAGPEGLADG